MPPKGILSYRPTIMGVTHMISTGHYLASAAGYRILEEGGNAVDAGVASGIAINVTSPHMTGFAGVAPIVLYLAETRESFAISGLGRWPKSVSLELFRDNYGEIPTGLPRSVVPAACDAWLTVLERFGTMSLEQVMRPAIDLAESGFPVSDRLARDIAGAKNNLAQWPESAAILMPNGNPLRMGDRLIQKNLSALFQKLVCAEQSNLGSREAGIRAARDRFYRGDIAARMVRFSEQHGGYLTCRDFEEFSVKIETPELGTYKDYSIITCGAWCQGPVLLQILNLLEGTDISSLGCNSGDYAHTLIEAVKLAFADREAYYGDPEFVDVPMETLLSKKYAAERRQLIDPNLACPKMPPPGNFSGDVGSEYPINNLEHPTGLIWEADTSYTCVVDRWGNVFSATPSDPQTATPMVPGLGLAISDRGSQSWLDKNHPSSIAPWKRPRLTPNPALAFKEGTPFMVFGTPGGDAQVQAMTQVFLNIVDFDMNPQQAIEAPRMISLSYPNSFWPHTYLPGRLGLEARMSPEIVKELALRGHDIEMWPDWTDRAGGACAILIDRKRGVLLGGADPRRESYVIGR